jgi:hypothetical protein
MRMEAGTSVTVAHNSVLHQHADYISLRCFVAVPNKGAATVPRQHLLRVTWLLAALHQP